MDSSNHYVPGQSAHPAGVAQRQSSVVFRDDEGQAVRLPSPASCGDSSPGRASVSSETEGSVVQVPLSALHDILERRITKS